MRAVTYLLNVNENICPIYVICLTQFLREVDFKLEVRRTLNRSMSGEK
jgi:hypothetical protein